MTLSGCFVRFHIPSMKIMLNVQSKLLKMSKQISWRDYCRLSSMKLEAGFVFNSSTKADDAQLHVPKLGIMFFLDVLLCVTQKKQLSSLSTCRGQ